MEYSGFWVSLEGVIPINKNGSNKTIMPMTSQKGVLKFIGLVNYYCGMWESQSNTLAPLSKLTSIKVKFKWAEVE